jgi:hypothetical protein
MDSGGGNGFGPRSIMAGRNAYPMSFLRWFIALR